MARCKICSAKTAPFARAVLLKRHDVAYHRCSGCGFLQTEEPYWLDEAYQQAITGTDIGLVARNIKLAKVTRSLISLCFNPAGKFLDYAGGLGLFVRLMRDAGYDFHLYDRYCKNIFAKGLEGVQGESYELVTALEVLEHVHAPLEEMELILNHSRNVLFSTELYPESMPAPDDWWYFGLNHGQHVSFFTTRSLQIMAEKLSLRYYTDGVSIHLFTEKALPPILFALALKSPVATLTDLLFRRPSLLPSDHAALLHAEHSS